MKIQWWYSEEFIDLLDNVVQNKLFLWEDVSDRQDELKAACVEDKNYMGAQLHKDLRDYAQQCWAINPLDQTETWWKIQSACIRLLCDVEEGRVDWSDVVVEQHELMIHSGEEDKLDAAMFHQKLKKYAEEVFINDDSTRIPITGQTGEE
jgi:hypothetical protein